MSGHHEVDDGWSALILPRRREQRNNEDVGGPVRGAKHAELKLTSGEFSLEREAGWKNERSLPDTIV